ncbi:MAG: hypothetical protein KDA42_18910 [Planctomycetales bacterium]|nr:hypothetical protein [Planctomycetales bacterium]
MSNSYEKRSTVTQLRNFLLHLGAVVLLLFAGTAQAAETTTILALGDSITAGGGSFVVYRQVLVPKLQERGLSCEFIGPNRDGTSAHAGYGGRNTHYLRSISQELYRKYPADIVLLHSGHNSFAHDEPVPGIVRDTEAMIATFREINPRVTILLAQVIPAGKLPKYSYIPQLNRELAVLAARLAHSDSRLVLVDQAAGFDWKTDTVADHVHPNAAGAEKMAAKWFAALAPLLEQRRNGHAEEADAD